MANYFVINNKFKPYSFDELIKPYQIYGQAYKEQEALLNSLMTEAATLNDLSPSVDKTSYDKYNNWKTELQNASNQLSTTGLNAQLRDSLRRLNTSYRTDYAPLIDKLKTRGALVKEQRDYLQKYPNTIFDIDYANVPVENINTSSTYNTYNLDKISTDVGQDVYNRMLSEQAVPSIDDYIANYSGNLTDEEQLERVREAVASGVSLGDATYKQKEFDNYINKVKATRTGRSYTYDYPTSTSGTTTSGERNAGSGFNVSLSDGTVIPVTYDKKTKSYTYKDVSGKLKEAKIKEGKVTKDIEEEIATNYYGGTYGTIDVAGIKVKRIVDKDGNYKIQTSSGAWEPLINKSNTSFRDFYKKYFGKEVSLPTEDQLSYRHPEFRSTWDKKVKKGKIEKEVIAANQIRDYKDSQNYAFKNVAAKLADLYSNGLLKDNTEITLYKAGNSIVGYDIIPSYIVEDWNAPIEADNYQ